MTERKTRYIEFCQLTYVPKHLQPWWLDAVCTPECWDVALASDSGGRITGVMPWYKKRRWGLWVIQQPPFTTYGGTWLCYPNESGFKLQSRYAFEKKVCTELIAQLPRTAFLLQNFRPEVENWLPFFWKGFRQTTRYTYIFNDTENLPEIMAGMKNTLRSDLKKAALTANWQQEDGQWEIVFQLNARSFQRKKMRQPYTLGTFQRLHSSLSERGQMACFIARDRISGNPIAGLYLASDERQASLLLSGTDPDHKYSCAIYGLFLEAIKYCGTQGLSLDFEGSMQPEIEHSFRAFGARQQPYFQVWKAQNRFLELIFQLTH